MASQKQTTEQETDFESLAVQFVYDWAPGTPVGRSAMDAALRTLLAEAWDEGARKACPRSGGLLRSFYAENPYR